LATIPILVQTQQVCTIKPSGCTIGSQACPTGCIKKARCGTTITQTQPASTVTRISTQTKTITQSASVITVTPSKSSSAAPVCATEVPYINLFAFPDSACKNSSLNLLELTDYHGLTGTPFKFNTLTYNTNLKSNGSTCATFDPSPYKDFDSLYFTVDGALTQNCYLHIYTSKDCSGPADELFGLGSADECLAKSGANGWNSALFECAYD
jgi:hypothetical protein